MTGLLLAASIASCGTQRQAVQPTQTVTVVQRDTIRLNTIRYDSVFIDRNRTVDRTRDTVYLTEKTVEYRYSLIRDTLHVIEKDSIPYPVAVPIETDVLKADGTRASKKESKAATRKERRATKRTPLFYMSRFCLLWLLWIVIMAFVKSKIFRP